MLKLLIIVCSRIIIPLVPYTAPKPIRRIDSAWLGIVSFSKLELALRILPYDLRLRFIYFLLTTPIRTGGIYLRCCPVHTYRFVLTRQVRTLKRTEFVGRALVFTVRVHPVGLDSSVRMHGIDSHVRHFSMLIILQKKAMVWLSFKNFVSPPPANNKTDTHASRFAMSAIEWIIIINLMN